MRLRYFVQEGDTVHESVHDPEDLPPNAARVLREHGLAYLTEAFFHWRLGRHELYWWVRVEEAAA